MKRHELKSIIRECLEEVELEEGAGSRATKLARQKAHAKHPKDLPHTNLNVADARDWRRAEVTARERRLSSKGGGE